MCTHTIYILLHKWDTCIKNCNFYYFFKRQKDVPFFLIYFLFDTPCLRAQCTQYNSNTHFIIQQKWPATASSTGPVPPPCKCTSRPHWTEHSSRGNCAPVPRSVSHLWSWWFMFEDKDWTTIIQQSKEKHKGKTLNEYESQKKHPSLFWTGYSKKSNIVW